MHQEDSMTKRIVNFSAGPATMPEAVLEEAQRQLLNYQETGMSIMEMSHRSTAYDEVHQSAINNVKKLLNIPNHYRVLFLQGGASHQFAMLPMNFAQENSVDVINTGSWTKKAIGELNKGYQHQVVATSENDNFLKLPNLSHAAFNQNAAYTYMCSNNTIFGTQFKTFPTHAPSPLVVDMSSDILSSNSIYLILALFLQVPKKTLAHPALPWSLFGKTYWINARIPFLTFLITKHIQMQIPCIILPNIWHIHGKFSL